MGASVIIAAAGSASRMCGIDKLLYKINDKEVILYSIEAFAKAKCVTKIVIVTSKDKFETVKELVSGIDADIEVCIGSDERQKSVLNGLALCDEKSECIMIHDAARPMITAEKIDFLYENGAKTVHMRSACPPIMYGCKYLNFSRNTNDMDLITRSTIYELEGDEGFNYIEEYSDCHTERGKLLRKTICDKLHFASLEFQSLEGIIKAIGLPASKLCTYCWNGKE